MKSPQIDKQNTTTVVEALSVVLNDTYRLMIKSQTYHWNVIGPLFYSIHNMTEELSDRSFQQDGFC